MGAARAEHGRGAARGLGGEWRGCAGCAPQSWRVHAAQVPHDDARRRRSIAGICGMMEGPDRSSSADAATNDLMAGRGSS